MKRNLIFGVLFSIPWTANALIPFEVSPCDPAAFGTHCDIHAKIKYSKHDKNPVHCGRAVLFLDDKQKAMLEAYTYEGNNMVVRFKLDEEFIDGNCMAH